MPPSPTQSIGVSQVSDVTTTVERSSSGSALVSIDVEEVIDLTGEVTTSSPISTRRHNVDAADVIDLTI